MTGWGLGEGLALAPPAWSLTSHQDAHSPYVAHWEEGDHGNGGKRGHAGSGRASMWLCHCVHWKHQQPVTIASPPLLGLVSCLPQLHWLHFLAMISAPLVLFNFTFYPGEGGK